MASKMQNKFVSKSIAKLYLQSKSADVHFAFTIDDEIVKVPAHKAILAIASPVFDAMFFGPMKENDVVEIIDADVSMFKEFLQLFYLPEVTITMENIEAVARLADKYDMLKCLNECAEFLESQLTKENIIWGYQLVITLNNQKLKRFCESEIQKLTSDIFKSNAFLHCDRSVLEHILQLDSLNTSEVDVFNTCIEWAKSACQRNGLDENDPENQRNQLGDCFHLIQFGAMTIDEIGLIMSNERYRKLFSPEEMADLLCMKTVKGFQSKVFKHIERALKWNSNEVLLCKLQDSNVDNRYFGCQVMTTWFSSNVPVLLGEINCTFIRHKDYRSFNFDSNITVVEFNDQSFIRDHMTKVLYTGTVNFQNGTEAGPSVALSQPILIQPKKLYAIRLETCTDLSGLYHNVAWKSEVKLGEKIIIKTHRNPLEPLNHGSVSVLHFNRI